jgi:hypothetical protein
MSQQERSINSSEPLPRSGVISTHIRRLVAATGIYLATEGYFSLRQERGFGSLAMIVGVSVAALTMRETRRAIVDYLNYSSNQNV